MKQNLQEPTRRTPTTRCLARLALLAATLVPACNALLDIDEPTLVTTSRNRTQADSADVDAGSDAGARACVLTSDCPDEQVCVFRVCSPPCQKDRDCADSQRCLTSGERSACVSNAIANCRAAEDCPDGTVCRDGACRSECTLASAACLSDQSCIDGACVGSDPSHDPNGAGMSDAATVPPDSGDSADSGVGKADCDDDELRCSGNASVEREICNDGQWQGAAPCGEGRLCDTSSEPAGSCVEVPADCLGRTPGESFCKDEARVTCGKDLVTTLVNDCESIQHCNAGQGEDCAVCLDNEFSCSGNELRQCKPDHTGFEHLADCVGAPCNEEAGACTEDACLPDQKRCEGDTLQICNDDQSAFEVLEECGAGLCDSANLECDICVSNVTACVDTDTRSQCSANGQVLTPTNCPGDAPFCVGDGQCVECTETSQCSADTCYVASCNVGFGTCQETPRAVNPHYPCGSPGSFCDGAGACVECINANDCGVTNACYAAICTEAQTCDEEPKEAGDECSFAGGDYCDGDGACVECVDAGDCTPTNECYTATCSGSNICLQSARNQASTCNNGEWNCNGGGVCVECNVAGDCPAVGECYNRVCNGNSTCGQTAKASGDACSGGNVCNGSGSCVDCVSAAQCTTDQVCRSSNCTNALHSIGWETAAGATITILADNLYFLRVPALTYDAQLQAFGLVGTSAGIPLRMALYADNGLGTHPSGAPLTEVVTSTAVGVREVPPAVMPTLSAGSVYWIAAMVAITTNIVAGESVVTGRRLILAPAEYANPLPTLSGTVGGGYSVQLAIYAKVEDTE